MHIKRVDVSLLLLGLMYSVHCLARPVEIPTLDDLYAKADLVAVIMPLSTTTAPDKLTSAGPKYGARDPRDYQALNTRCKVVLVMKKSEELQGWRTNELTLLHFRYAPSIPEFNGGMFMYFDLPETELNMIVKGDASHPIAQDRQPTYLAFLRRAPDGRFHPITGHYDSETSFRVLATPQGGAIRYAVEDGRRKQKGEANHDGPANGSQPIRSETNRTSSAAGSRR